MTQHALIERIALSAGSGYIPCSADYKAAFDARNALHQPRPEQYGPEHLAPADRQAWFELNAQMDRLQWLGGHVGATVFYDGLVEVPHGWIILKKRDKADEAPVTSDRDGQWHSDSYYPYRYVTQTGDNGENDLGLGYAISSVKAARERFAKWATRREKPADTEFLLFACYQVDEGELVPAPE